MKDEIKKALEQATPGPWTYQKGRYARAHIVYEDATDNCICSFSTHPDCEANGHLIANAPTYLKWQNERIEQLEKVLERIAESDTSMFFSPNDLLVKEIIKIARQALGKEEQSEAL